MAEDARPERLRAYADTAVFGGCLDERFAAASQALFRQIAQGRFLLLVSNATTDELESAPVHVQELLDSLPGDAVESIQLSQEIVNLRDAYLAADVVGPASQFDAGHIAAASVAEADLIVSWN